MKKIMMALAPLLILTACTSQAGVGKLNKYQLNKPNKEFNKYIQESVSDGYTLLRQVQSACLIPLSYGSGFIRGRYFRGGFLPQ